MEKMLILVSGMPGVGKTTFANYLSEKCQLALISKDKLKEIIWDRIEYDPTETQVYGGVAYDLSFHFCEMLMKMGQSVILESNFVDLSWKMLQPLVSSYNYQVVNVLFDGDPEVVHRRVLERDETSERHSGLILKGYFDDFDVFKRHVQACRDFKYGDVLIHVDTTDFAKVCYDDLIEAIKLKITRGE